MTAPDTTTPIHSLPDALLLDRLQRGAFAYFARFVNPANGLVADTSRNGSPVSIAVVGFALSSYPIGVEHGWMARADALRLTLAALRFFRDSDQSGTAQSTGRKGFYFHFLDIHTGLRVWQSELSMIDTALLIGGVLMAACYFDADTAEEVELREIADALYRRIDWLWAQDGGDTIKQGWKPESGFLHYGWEGYSEAILLYVLAMGSPTHPVMGDCYEAWTATYQWENLYDIDFLYAGPLFVHQFSHAWIDLRGIQDSFMRCKRCDYFENSRRAVAIQREYAQRNPSDFVGYDENCWGLTACDGPSDNLPGVDGEPRQLFGYAARGVPYGPDDGTLGASAVLASLPLAPVVVLGTVRNLLKLYPAILTEDRLASSFNPSITESDDRMWISRGHYGLDQGIVALMLENQRSGLIWKLMRKCSYVVDGLRAAGFRGGLLAHPSKSAR
ncbi:MAG: glucoamylase family protein [Dokdonella sp.]